jgi:hypothetical protein
MLKTSQPLTVASGAAQILVSFLRIEIFERIVQFARYS